MLSTSFKGMEIPTYTDEEIKQKLSKDDMMDYVIGLDSMLYNPKQRLNQKSKKFRHNFRRF